ncbi:MAG: hypothetical protein JSR85_07230 [Proteobacteria bacterium]|nr:hypothetical protein [Pseudomonadota bacterium]
MKRQKFFVKTFLIFYFMLAIVAFFFLALADFNGDLTRLGKLSEYAFGWKKKKPKIDPNLLKSSSFKDSDIVVVGDSFSEKFIWQTRLTKNNYKVKTIDWEELDQKLCTDFEELLISHNFRGKLIIIETVQRMAEIRASASLSCDSSKTLLDYESTMNPPLISLPKFGLNFKEKIITGIETFFNTIKAVSNPHADSIFIEKDGGHRVALKPLKKGCKWFSNRYCEIGVFLDNDLDFPSLTNNTIDKIKKINASFHQFKIVWLVVPDKSSIYTEREELEFWKELEKNNLGPDLFSSFIKERDKIVDLYLPNDTHLSSAGSLFMGELAKQWIETH